GSLLRVLVSTRFSILKEASSRLPFGAALKRRCRSGEPRERVRKPQPPLAVIRRSARRHRRKLRILPAEDGEDGADAVGVDQDPGTAAAALRVGHLWRRGL